MRQLAAILFTDIAGYTAIMQSDEQRALEIRSMHRDIFEKSHQSHEGTIIQYYGDGTLSIFNSAVQAVQCSVEMQRQLRSHNIPVRMGLHVGDIVYDQTDVYGDGVNVAARIESMSVPGAILISDRISKELQNQKRFSTKTLGHYEFKNVREPLEVFAITNDELVVPDPETLQGMGSPVRSIAVLPFVNMSSSAENEYFSDGITEEIINALTKIKELKVTSRTSSFHFKGSELKLQEIAKQLNVAIVLEGSVRLAGNQVRITAQLIDVREDVHFWSETFDRLLDNIFALQDEISLLIADKIREHVGHLTIDDHLVKDLQVPFDAYAEYLQARFHLLKMSKDSLNAAEEQLEKLVARQPDYAYAYLGMHQLYTTKGTLGLMPSSQAFAEGHKYLERAIQLDSSLPECQLQLSWMSFLQDWDAAAAYKHLEKVQDERPIVDYYQTMVSILTAERKLKAARQHVETALQLDPFSEISHHLKGFIYYLEGQFEEAIHWYRKSMELRPGSEVSVLELGLSLVLLERYEEALKHFQEMPEASAPLLKSGGEALVYYAMGQKELAAPGLSKLIDAKDSELVEHALHMLILCETVSGHHEKALEYLEEAISYRFPLLVYIKVDPIMKPLENNPRYQALMAQVLPTTADDDDHDRKYKRSLIDAAKVPMYRQRVTQLMQEERPYLDPYLTLRDLAEKVELNANQLSQLLNEGFDQNFAEYVNSYRLTTFKEKASNPDNKQFTLLALAYESGFNSKTVFNTYFKKATGMTPKAFWKSVHT